MLPLLEYLAEALGDDRLAEAAKALADVTAKKAPIALPVPDSVLVLAILREAGARFGCRVDQIKSDGRIPAVVAARAVSAFLIRRYYGASFPRIGAFLGGKDHSSVMAMVARVEKDPAMMEAAEGVLARLRGESR